MFSNGILPYTAIASQCAANNVLLEFPFTSDLNDVCTGASGNIAGSGDITFTFDPMLNRSVARFGVGARIEVSR